jgi:signal transduction histidine kinase
MSAINSGDTTTPSTAKAGAAVARPAAPPDQHRGRLFRKYLVLILTLVSAALLASGGISLYFSYQENKAALASLQHEKAIAAASRIEQYVRQISAQLQFASLPQLDAADLELRRVEFLKLLRQAPEVTDIAWIDAEGRERNAVSRLGMDVTGSQKDRSDEPPFKEARRGQPWYGPVYFRKETEPYMTVAVRSGSDKGPVTVAEVNLKFIWDVVSRIKIGGKGKAYVVDTSGLLVADPDIGLVLRKTSMAELDHVKAAGVRREGDEPAMVSHDLGGTRVLTSWAPITALNWKVFVEQPVAEVYEKLNASILRTAALLLAGLVISAAAASALARSMVQPIRVLDEGARRIGAGDLDQRIEVRTGDELEGLAEQFNTMSAQLRESYAGLERKVEQRTAELSEALEQQTATAEVLQVISGSVSDTQPVFEKILERCSRLFESSEQGIVLRGDDGLLHLGAHRGSARDALQRMFPRPLGKDPVTQAMSESRVLHYADVLRDAEPGSHSRVVAERLGVGSYTQVFTPMSWEGRGVGYLYVIRFPVAPFSDKEIALLKTFADQAAIAIQNARLFNETREALERQTATAEILQVISGSVADAQPVFDAIVASCQRLFGGLAVNLLMPAGERLHRVARAAQGPTGEQGPKDFPFDVRSVAGACVVQARVIAVDDSDAVAATYPLTPELARSIGWRSGLFVPLVREGAGVGCIGILRAAPGGFADKEVALAQTFADQAVIAIQNARLFAEIEDKTRQLEAANRHKSEFLANMSHELRTPLNAIIGFSEVLTEQMFGEVNAKQMEYLQDIHSSGEHLLSLINDVLDLSKIEAGRMELDLSCFDLGLLLEHSTTLVRERAQRHGLVLTLDVGEGLEEWVADARKIKQVVVNLLSNAVKFTPNGGRVTVKARHLNGVDGHAGDWAEVQVIDSGIGIKPEDQALVFEEFRQASGDVLRKSEGTGLGLALVRRFVELHGGRVTLASAPGQGSTFTFTLPQHEVEVLQ